MAIYAIETKFSPAEHKEQDLSKTDLRTLLAQECAGVQWMAFARLGPCDYVDILEAPDEELATKAALLIRSNNSSNHQLAETSVKLPWYRCLRKAKVEVLP